MLDRKIYAKGIAAAFVLWIAVSMGTVRAAIPEYRFHTLPETSYYGGIQAVAKDSIGRIWFSGYDALYMYNGNAFVRMDDRVTSLAPESYWTYGLLATDRCRRLYAATNHGLLRFDYAAQAFDCVLDGGIASLATDADGTVWVVRHGRVESYDADRTPEVRHYPLPEGFGAPALICSSGSSVFVASGGRLARLDSRSGAVPPPLRRGRQREYGDPRRARIRRIDLCPHP